jgi:glycosyltransferase involved in cell wall biosynthesis
LNLKNAELVLAGSVHPEIQPVLNECANPSIRVLGFVENIADVYRSAAVHAFPSECEGSAKCTYEAAATGLPQITTREAGDVVLHEHNGWIIPPNDENALCDSLQRLHADRDLCARLGAAGRQRVMERFTWTHFAESLFGAYRRLGLIP